MQDFAVAHRGPRGPLPRSASRGASRGQAPPLGGHGTHPAAVSRKDPVRPTRARSACRPHAVWPQANHAPHTWSPVYQSGRRLWAPLGVSPPRALAVCQAPCSALNPHADLTGPAPLGLLLSPLPAVEAEAQRGQVPASRHTAGGWGTVVTTVPPVLPPLHRDPAAPPLSASRRQQRLDEGSVAPVPPHLSVLWPSAAPQPCSPGGGGASSPARSAFRGSSGPPGARSPPLTVRETEARRGRGDPKCPHPHGTVSVSSFFFNLFC